MGAELGAGGGSGYPSAIDTDAAVEIDKPNAGYTKARADVPNDLSAAIVAIQGELGTDPAGDASTVKAFLQTEHGTDGTHAGSGGITLVYNGLSIKDSDASHDLRLSYGTNITADRVLTITTADADASLYVAGTSSINQALLNTSSPRFGGLVINATSATEGGEVALDGGGANPGWEMDVYGTTWRVKSASTAWLTVGPSSLLYNGDTVSVLSSMGNPAFPASSYSLGTKAGGQSITNAVATGVTFAQTTDRNGEYDPATGIFTVAEAGLYVAHVLAQYSAQATAVNYRKLYIELSGVTVGYDEKRMGTEDNATSPTLSAVAVVYAGVGDTIQVKAYHDSGVTLSINAGATFTVARLG
jgi:hypothetical protein